MSEIENDAWVEAVARAICEAEGGCLCLGTEMPCEDRMIQACVAIHVLAPLIIERCAEVATRHAEEHARSLGAYGAADVDSGRGRQEGHIDAGNAIAENIRAMIQKEASHAEV